MLSLTDSRWPERLQRVCEQRRITALFQPIVDLPRGVVAGYEAFSDFGDPEIRSPEAWFAAAALHGYGSRLEALALEAILAHRADLPPNTFLSVNVSPEGLQSLEVTLALGGQDSLAGVVIEITEQTPVADYPAFLAALDGIRARGALIAVDDTGAGYAGISHLLAVRPHFVKLDRGVVTGLDRDPQRVAAVAAIGAFADELDAWIIAEGVEFPAELQRLIDLRVPLVQGYLLGRPAPSMQSLAPLTGRELRERAATRRDGRLGALARPAPAVAELPAHIPETTVLTDGAGRPVQVAVPRPGGRPSLHPAMCVLAHERVADVSLRAGARGSEDRYSPLCLVDDRHRLIGVIPVEALLESLARTRS